MKKFIVLVINLILVIALFGCGANNKTTYVYDNDKVMDEVTIKKSVFTDEKLTIYISELGECLSLEAYDANFNCLENDFDYEYKNGKLIIKGKGAEEISGLKIRSSSYQEIKLRYLDSNQYAILIDYFVDDFGTTTHGDWNSYFTEEERAAQQVAKDERIRQQEENYKAVEGYWESVKDNGEYIYIYTDENGDKRLRQALISYEELNIQDTHIQTINISEIGRPDYYAYYELEILDSYCYGFCFQFDLNEDKTAIMDWSTKEAGFIKLEGVLPDDLTSN